MSGVKHTPGPWRTSGVYIDSDHGTVGHANFSDDLTAGSPVANAHLIAAAPDLLEALEAVELARHSDEPADWLRATRLSDAAIARARGEQDGGGE